MGGMFVRQFCRLWVGLWVTLLSVGALDLTQGPIVVPTATNAVVRWSTDHASGTRLYFGTDRKHIETRIDTATVTGDHEVKISGLKAGTTYWYTVGTARMPLATNSFTTAGVHDGPPEVVGPSSPTQSPTSVSKANAPPKTTPVSAFDPTQIKVPPARDTWGHPVACKIISTDMAPILGLSHLKTMPPRLGFFCAEPPPSTSRPRLMMTACCGSMKPRPKHSRPTIAISLPRPFLSQAVPITLTTNRVSRSI